MAVKRRVPKSPRSGAADPIQTPGVRPHQAPPRGRADHRGSAPHRQRRTPKAAFDYADGAAEDELSIARARQAFRDIEFHPTILRDVTNVAAGWNVLGQPVAWPFAIAPTGFTRLMHTEGEIAGARAAASRRDPVLAIHPRYRAIEDVVTAVPQGRKWFQLYMWRDRDRSMALVQRAADAGFDTLLATVDVPVAGARLRDIRNGMSIPPALTLRTVLDAVPHPHWWFDLLTTEPLSFASLDRWSGTVGEYLDTMFDPSLTFDDLEWIKAAWPASSSSRGSRHFDDARAVVDRGVDGIVLSNHGGRQLDRAPVPFHLLPAVARDLGKHTEILLDTGIMSGADIVAAIALGARCTLVGRAYLYGLMAGGEAGVNRAIEILEAGVTPDDAAAGCDLPGGAFPQARDAIAQAGLTGWRADAKGPQNGRPRGGGLLRLLALPGEQTTFGEG